MNGLLRKHWLFRAYFTFLHMMNAQGYSRQLEAAPSDWQAVSSVQKACRILRVMSDRESVRLTDIADAAGLDKATTLRLLRLLVYEGFVCRDQETKGYAYGRELFNVTVALRARSGLRALARESLIRLADLFGDTSVLSVPSGVESVCVDLQLGKFTNRMTYLEIGSRSPLGVGADSLALLCALPDDELDPILPRVADCLHQYPRISLRFLKEQIAPVRSKGYAMLLDVVAEHIGGVGVPILDSCGRLIGALGITAQTDRILAREDALGRALKREAGVISSLYHRGVES